MITRVLKDKYDVIWRVAEVRNPVGVTEDGSKTLELRILEELRGPFTLVDVLRESDE